MNAEHDLLIRDGTVVDVSGRRRVLEHHDVAVDGECISAVGPPGSLGSASRVIEAAGRAVLPGLVNCHTHAAMSLFRGTSDVLALQTWLAWVGPYGIQYTEGDIYWGTLLAICQMLRGGITSFADMYTRQEVVAAAVQKSGMRAVLGESILAHGIEGSVRGSVEQQTARAEDFVRTWNGSASGRISASIAPHSVYGCDVGLLRELAAMARAAGCRMQTHISETAIEVEECLSVHGCRPPQLLADTGCFDVPMLGAHCVHLDDTDIQLFATYGVAVSHNPGSNLKLQSGLAPVPAMLRGGLRVGLGTDSAGSNDSLELWRDCYLAAVLHRWGEGEAPAWNALELATAGGSAAVGLDAQIGTIEPGKRADLILVDLTGPHLAPVTDPVLTLAYAVRGGEVETVLIDGEVVMQDRRIVTVDESEVIQECRRRAERIFRS